VKKALLILIFCMIPICVFSLGKGENTRESTMEDTMEDSVKILGTVQIFGNEPHSYAGIVDEEGYQYSIYPPSQEELLRGLQGHLIEFTVIKLETPQGYGSLFLRAGTVTPVSWEIIR
jgi:hypothetical protein